MDLQLLTVGVHGHPGTSEELLRAGATTVAAAEVEPAAPAVDAELDRRDGRRLVIEADLAGLNLVLYRLMRRGELETADTAVLLGQPIDYLQRLGLPPDRANQVRVALAGQPRLVGVIKHDSGGLCVDGASLVPDRATSVRARRRNVAQSGDGWWLRAVVDDQRLCDGAARGVQIRRLGPAELEATVLLERHRLVGVPIGRAPRRTCRGRSAQLACDDALIVEDGQQRERPRTKRTFWSEPKLWRLAMPTGASDAGAS